MLYGLAVRVVEPVLCETGTHENAASGVIDRRLVGQVSGEGHLIKNFHLASPRLLVGQSLQRQQRSCRVPRVGLARAECVAGQPF